MSGFLPAVLPEEGTFNEIGVQIIFWPAIRIEHISHHTIRRRMSNDLFRHIREKYLIKTTGAFRKKIPRWFFCCECYNRKSVLSDNTEGMGVVRMKNCKVFIIIYLFVFFSGNTVVAGEIDIQHYFDEGNTYFNDGKYDKAIEAYSRLIAIYPDFIQGYYNRGLAYYRAGKYDKAVADYSRVISSPAEPNAELYSNRAIAYLKKGDYENALKDYSTVISMNPRLPDAYHNRGIAYANIGKYDDAIEDYNRVISMKPNDMNVYFSRAVAYTKKAMADFKKACDAGSQLACDNFKQLSK
jgi:tetratricopeptide (TPR) repeat protein